MQSACVGLEGHTEPHSAGGSQLDSSRPPVESADRIDKDELKDIHEDVVLCSVDKSSHDFGAICKHYYRHWLREQVSVSTGTFEKASETEKEIVERLQQICDDRQLQIGDCFPYLYGSLKIHKPVEKGPTLRGIAGLSGG